MEIRTHGGKCCGIKIIEGFGHPKINVGVKVKKKAPEYPGHGLFEYNNPGDFFFWEEAPIETYTQRLDRYIAFLERVQPKGLIEVTLTSGQYKQWRYKLQCRRFRLVTKFANSNSGSTVYVMHRVHTKEGK